jgi:hypothetical protein
MKPSQYAAMLASPRCGAKTRTGNACAAPSVLGKKRCRMHGGAQGSGAPLGNKNALKSGYYTREERERRRHVNKTLREISRAVREHAKKKREAERLDEAALG